MSLSTSTTADLHISDSRDIDNRDPAETIAILEARIETLVARIRCLEEYIRDCEESEADRDNG